MCIRDRVNAYKRQVSLMRATTTSFPAPTSPDSPRAGCGRLPRRPWSMRTARSRWRPIPTCGRAGSRADHAAPTAPRRSPAAARSRALPGRCGPSRSPRATAAQEPARPRATARQARAVAPRTPRGSEPARPD